MKVINMVLKSEGSDKILMEVMEMLTIGLHVVWDL